VWVDEPWRHHESLGVYLASTPPHIIADSYDSIPLYRDVASLRGVPRAINDDSVSNYKIRAH
jgi:hypothetical protein